MTKLLRRALTALALMAGITPAIAQTYPTVPAQSVIGRLGQPGDTGPSQALLFSTLRSQLRVPTIPSIYAVDSGVKCDGVTDDAPAIQRAINTADLAGNVQIIMPAGTCAEKSATPFLNKWTSTSSILTVPGLNITGQGRGVTTLDNQTGGFAISVNPDWRAAHLSLSGITFTTGGPAALGGSAPIAALGAITAGSAYTNGTYNGVALTGGGGTGATANITVAGGVVTVVTLATTGTGYAAGNVLSATAASIGGTGSGFTIPVASVTYYVQITVNTPQGDEVFVMLPKSIAVSATNSQIAMTLAPLNAGYSYNAYCDTTPTPAHYCFVTSSGNVSAFNGGQSISIGALGSARTIPTNKLAVWQEAHVSDMSVTSSTNTAGSSCISYFKVGYANVTNVYCHHLQGTGFELTDYTGDLDGSFMVAIKNSKFDTISGWCVDASGLALEMSNFTVDDRTIFNICGTLPTNYVQPQNYSSSGFSISSITASATPVVTTAVPHTLQTNDQVYIRGVTFATGTLPDGWYRASVLSGTTYNLKDLNGQFINTTGFGASSNGASMLAWRPPSPTNGVTGCLRWMGLIGTFRNSDFTQCNNVAMYLTEIGSSDNLTVDGVDFENTYGKAFYAASLLGGSMTNTECLTAIAFGPTISCVQLGTGSASGGVQNFQVQNMKVRSNVTPSTAFEQFQNTNLTGSFVDTNRVNNTSWQTYDAAGQTRFNGFNFDPIPGQFQFTVSATNTFKVAPIGIGATMPLRPKATGEWVPFRVPDAGVTFAVTTSAINTLYNVYAFNGAAAGAPYALSFTVDTVTPVFSHGFYTQSTDASHLFVGQALTDGSGNFQAANFQLSQYPIQVTAPITLTGGAIACPSCVLISGTAHGDSAYAILATDRYVYTNANFTAPRTWTLPAASTVAKGTTIWIEDAQNTVTSTNTLTISRAGADTINVSSTTLVITGQGGGITFTSDGVSNWGVPVQTVSTAGTGRQTLTNHGLLAGAGINPITQLAVGTNGQLLLGATGADPAFGSMSQDCTITSAGVITCTKTNNVSFAAVATSGSATDLTAGTLPAARLGGMSNITNSLAGNTAMNNTANYFAGPTVAQGTSGTWWASGSVTVTDTGAGANIICKLWDGTTVIDSGSITTTAVGQNMMLALSGVLASPAANIRIDCRDTTAITGLILNSASGNGKDSTVTALRIN